MLRRPALKGRSGGPTANRSATVGEVFLSRPQGGRRLAPQTGRLRYLVYHTDTLVTRLTL